MMRALDAFLGENPIIAFILLLLIAAAVTGLSFWSSKPNSN